MSADVAKRVFRPPPWCCAPKNPRQRRQELLLTQAEPPKDSAPAVVAEIFDKALYTIGRSDTADIRLSGELASRLHAAVLQDAEGRKFIVDLKSTHGTFLGPKKLEPHVPNRWQNGIVVSLGSGPKAEIATLGLEPDEEEAGSSSPLAKRKRLHANAADAVVMEGAAASNPLSGDSRGFSLYDGLPEAVVTESAPKAELANARFEPLQPLEEDPTKVLFLDIDGVLRPVHGRQDAFANARTIEINGSRVPLLGSGEAKAGIDFWPSAMRALRHIVQKSGARLVLSSDWRKEAILKQGIAAQLEEYRMPPLYGETPDLDQTSPGVIKALHTSFREKRCKEIRKWLAKKPKVTRWVAIDDVDLSLPDKEAKRGFDGAGGHVESNVFLDPGCEFVRTSPSTGLTMDLARLAICFLNGLDVTGEILDAAYGAGPTA